MKCTLPVSMYFSFSFGKVVVWKLAQWLHVETSSLPRAEVLRIGMSGWERLAA